jgi:hypothetical protein
VDANIIPVLCLCAFILDLILESFLCVLTLSFENIQLVSRGASCFQVGMLLIPAFKTSIPMVDE